MQKLFYLPTIILAIACNSSPTAKPENNTVVKPNADTTKTTNATVVTTTPATLPAKDSITIAIAPKGKDVIFYYKKYADVDSEDPSIGVGPRKIITKDLAKGIITYQAIGAPPTDTKINKIQVWNKNGYDVINYPGGWLVEVNGKYQYLTDADKLYDKIIKNRTAKGGECNYNSVVQLQPTNGDINKVDLILTCSNDQKFKETIGYLSVANNKIVTTAK